MKTALIMILGLLTSNAFAADYSMPEKLYCRSGAQATSLQNFELSGLSGDAPVSNNLTGDLVAFESGNQVTRLEFTNNVDNNYEVTFYTEDLQMLATGEITFVNAMISYFEGEMSETILANCQLK